MNAHRICRVALVALGAVSQPETYRALADTYAEALEDPEIEVEVFTDTNAALEFSSPRTDLESWGVLVFLSGSLKDTADQIATEHPQLRVLVCSTIALPPGRATVIKKDSFELWYTIRGIVKQRIT